MGSLFYPTQGLGHNYRPPTKLREDNVFTAVCHSVLRERRYLWYQVPYSRLKVQKLRDQSEVSVRSGYRVGKDLVRTGYARMQPGILWGIRSYIRSGYRVGTD